MSDWTITEEDGRTEVVVPATTSEQHFRIGVGQPEGPRSAVWRFVARGPGDIYIGDRATMNQVKLSLHESGKRRLAFTGDYARARGWPQGTQRKILEWIPAEVAPGWVHELAIWVAQRDVTTLVPPAGNKRIEWIEKPRTGRAVILRVQTIRLGSGGIQFEQRGWQAVKGLWWNRPAGPELCLITATHHDLTNEQIEQREEARRDLPLTTQERERLHTQGLRFMEFGEAGGMVRLHDCSFV